MQVQVDNGALGTVPHGSGRDDTRAICGQPNTGFAYLLNYNTLPVGTHTVRIFADGVLAAFEKRVILVERRGFDFSGESAEFRAS